MALIDKRKVTLVDDLDAFTDCDLHLTESEADLLPYVDSTWDELLRKPLESNDRGWFL
jgi:hypothetical protein